MQFTPLQLKEKLLGALDEENNIVNTSVVLEVITILEKFPITREALEITRIGRYVNELRKKTSNEELAKRAKKLVRGWQKLVTVPEGPHINGDSISTPPQHRNISALQNAGNGSKPSSPAISSPAINRNCVVRSSLSPAIGNRPVTPSQQRTLQPNKLGKAGDLNKSKHSPGLSKTLPSALKPVVNSPKQTLNVQTSNLSPAVSQTFPPQAKAESSGKSVKSSPKSRPSTPCQSPSLTCSSQSAVTIGNEDSLSSLPCTPTSVDNLQTGNGHTKRKKRGRKPKSGKKSNHSAESAISPNDGCSRSEQCDVPKTDIANRKRVRLDKLSTTPVKQQKLNTSIHSLSSKQPLNGIVYSDKTCHNAVVNNSANSDPKTQSTSTEYSTPGSKKSLMRQDSTKPAVKTPKVKTTAELIADYQQKTGSTSYGNNILEKLRTNQIDHESDVQTSVLPPGIKPRKKRISNDSSILSVPSPSLSQTKTELVEKFLQTSVSPTLTDLSPPLEDYSLKSESPINSSQNSVQASTSDLKITIKSVPSVSIDQQKIAESKPLCAYNHSEISNVKHSTEISESTENKVEKRLTIEEIYSQLPPIDFDSINWECTDYIVPEPTPSNDLDVNRIINDQWEGINGSLDKDKVWHDWASTLTLSSVDDDPLHVLPYVDVND
ncbi:hypothetical protein LOTGIDRAFT_227949 [Lottia gigantea]|uniref:Mediator of RNA polymerase II transcription subunit 26 n=1 Tax=Lottia gigantea TaxID=225164 RepID=V4CS11_LOTGI|nr:hypothetical protein LOTGIDRAFT_227949 [Lottia gigantea]ESP05315.1 hypothetical protein LOTGIDRAFT_227949 [Lottia gigantea]